MSLSFLSTELGSGEFVQRRLEARRNGAPAWLWPEVSTAQWSAAMRCITAAAGAVLAGKSAELPAENPMALSLACYTAGVGPLLGWWVERGLVTCRAETRELLELHRRHAREREKSVRARSTEIVSRLSSAGVSSILLKGGYTAYVYFADPASRPASDLDLLVLSNCRAEAEAVLAAAGMECVGRGKRESSWSWRGTTRDPKSLWLVHADDPWSIDLHHSLDFIASPGAPLVSFDAEDPFADTEAWPLDPRAQALRQPLLLLHLAVHASGGFHSLTLMRIIEMVLVARRDFDGDAAAWDEFIATAARTKGLGAAYPALKMAEELAPGTIPDGVLRLSAELAPPRVRSIVDTLDPATVHRVDRSSIAEHFMWVTEPLGWVRQLRSDLLAHGGSSGSLRSIYEARISRLLRGRVTR